MTFTAQEISVEDGQPLELYLFELSGVPYAFNNGEIQHTFNAQVYEPVFIKRGKLKNQADKSTQQLEITTSVANEFSALYLGIPPGERARVTVFQVHTTDGALEHRQIFKGIVATVSYGNEGKEATVVARPLSAAGTRPMPRRTYQSLCNNNLYDDLCTLDEVDFQETGTVIAESNRNITLAGLTNLGAFDDYWETGYVEFGNERRLINLQTTDVFKLNIEFKNSPLNQTVRVVPGCKHRRQADCFVKFNNVLNFGGFSFVPLKNPFESGLD